MSTVFGATLASMALVAPAQAAVECGDTITQDRKLKADLVDCPAAGLTIQGQSITLDMNGHKIDGTGQNGIDVTTDSNGVAIKNGKVKDAGSWGILANDSNDDLRITDVKVVEPGSRGIQVSDSEDVKIRRTVVRRASTGFYLSGVDDPLVSDVAVVDGVQTGVDLSSVDGLTLNHASIRGNDDGVTTGIAMYGGTGNEFSDIELEDWSDRGFLASGVGGGNVVEDVTSRSNFYGFVVNGADGLKFRRVVGSGNGDDGLLVLDGDVRVTGGRFNGNADDGLELMDGTTGAVGGNVAKDNGDIGITVGFPGVTDLGGNHASGNDGAVQCVNVNC